MIIFNGSEEALGEDKELNSFLTEKGFDKTKIAVEINNNIILKSQYSETILHSGDTIEVVSFVGGG